jgi:hypothetical protein
MFLLRVDRCGVTPDSFYEQNCLTDELSTQSVDSTTTAAEFFLRQTILIIVIILRTDLLAAVPPQKLHPSNGPIVLRTTLVAVTELIEHRRHVPDCFQKQDMPVYGGGGSG